MWLDIKRRITKSELFTRILTEIETTNGAVKMASATFQLVQAPDFNVNVKKNNNRTFPPFSLLII
jgi:hypothetical protein